MKRTHLLVVVFLSLITLILAYSQSPTLSPQSRQVNTTAQIFTLERQVGTQQRINRYFHGDVVPKLKNCWSNVKGKGRISLKYTYTKTRGRWFLSGVETRRSTLPAGQDAVAQKCMLEAVRGSSFEVEADESKQTAFVLNWTWPVPFPVNAAQLTQSMFSAKPTGTGGVGGGCDGWGTPPSCMACKQTCDEVCVGYSECGGDVTQTTCRGKCASGGPFGVTGGSIIF